MKDNIYDKKFNFKKLIFLLILPLLFLIGIFIFLILSNNPIIENTTTAVNNYITNSNVNSSNYDTIKQDENEKYTGVGQQKVQGKNGYFTTFSTTTKELPNQSSIPASSSINNNDKLYKEYKQNGSSTWSSNPYWEGTMETDGCGITALSIILSGYGKNFTPEMLRVRYFPVLNMDNFSSELSNTFGIKNSGFFFDSKHLSNEYIDKHLQTGRPVLVCVWNKPTDNRWTTASHYMVLLATDCNGMVYVSNPNGLENNSKSSGWYDLNEITKYIAKALFVESY